ncbi:aspartate/glutamate racemase family protein [Phyllobacterium sp. YR531]|uniref:aspartate/glutamate racemase family protein n=1 Tax=Phyllobacterium sp. YR531 TaxID=1144343 RepID=UPI00026FB2DC|nr:aspartate/glutamate racemase family protein [Phyllobacterium sp. YR531]EJM99380.1 Asp/Glu/Hydantoin racemase [Phyllobacterium sp. YR531]
MRIALLHTAESNVVGFEQAGRTLGLSEGTLVHEVRADLLLAAREAGGLTASIAKDTALALRALTSHADVVVLTCSTLGPSIDEVGAKSVPILRVDAALAEHAVRGGGLVVALCALDTTVEPTTRLFAQTAAKIGAQVDVRLIPDIWDLLLAGNHAAYYDAIAKAADAAYDKGASVVALAQASMSPAADLVMRGPRPLDSPSSGLAAAIAIARAAV